MPPTTKEAAPDGGYEHEIAVVGAGFAGLAAAIKLADAGFDDLVVLERSHEVGGTWRDNSYPGCQCDVPSHLYSFSFAPNPDWSRTYSRQPEIRTYLNQCAERFDVKRRISFGEELIEARWKRGAWEIETSRRRLRVRVLIGGFGPLNEPVVPQLPGAPAFGGQIVHSMLWQQLADTDIDGRNVAVVGTGATAIQLVAAIQPHVQRLHVFQRTPAWVMPHTDRPTSALERWLYRRFPPAQLAVRRAVFWMREVVGHAITHQGPLLRVLEIIGRAHLRQSVPNPALRRRLRPSYRVGCKRIMPSNHYYRALTQTNVELHGPPACFEDQTLVCTDGTRAEVDTRRLCDWVSRQRVAVR